MPVHHGQRLPPHLLAPSRRPLSRACKPDIAVPGQQPLSPSRKRRLQQLMLEAIVTAPTIPRGAASAAALLPTPDVDSACADGDGDPEWQFEDIVAHADQLYTQTEQNWYFVHWSDGSRSWKEARQLFADGRKNPALQAFHVHATLPSIISSKRRRTSALKDPRPPMPVHCSVFEFIEEI